MKYFIGIDGGGTKTKCILADENLNIIYQTTGGPSNFLMLGNEKVSETLFQLVKECLEQNNVILDNVGMILLGTTGGGRRNDAESLEKYFIEYFQSKSSQKIRFKVESDARIALEGAFSGNAGSILIAGTGSIMFGKDKFGNIHRVGGFGRFIGDEGSGFRIGQRGLNAVSKEYDGRGIKTLISKFLYDQFSIKSPEELITEIYKNNFDIASIAPLVIKAAEQKDEIAINIIETESDEIILHIDAMRKKLNENKMNLSFIGSLLTNENFYSYLVKEKIVVKFDDVIIREAENPPEFGAVLMAKSFYKDFITH